MPCNPLRPATLVSVLQPNQFNTNSDRRLLLLFLAKFLRLFLQVIIV